MSSKLEKCHSDIKEIDIYIHKYSEKIQKLRHNRKIIEDKLKKILIDNKLTNRTIQISATNSSIRLVETEKRENVTQKFVKNSLINFFNTPKNKEISADAIFKYMLNNRKLSKILELKVKTHNK